MKKFNFCIGLAMLGIAMASFASCSQDDGNNLNGNGAEGAPAYLTIRIAPSNTAATKVTGEEVPGQGFENTLKTADVYIFDNKGVLETVVSGQDVATSTKVQVLTTSGTKTVYVVTNSNNAITATEGTLLDDFRKQVITAIATPAPTGSDIAVDIASTSAGFLMIGHVAGVPVEATAPEGNTATPVTVKVSRAVSKAQVLFGATAGSISSDGASGGFSPAGAAATFSEAGFQLAQYATQMNVGGTEVATREFTPWTSDPLDAYWVPTRDKGFDQFNDDEDPQPTILEISRYAPENIFAGTPLNNQVTVALIKAKATITKWTEDGDADAEGGTFYVLAKLKAGKTVTDPTNPAGEGIKSTDILLQQGVYSTSAKAKAAWDLITVDQNQYAIFAYTGGLCYYRLNLNDNTRGTSAEKYSVVRNSFYRITVDKVLNFGSNNPEDLVDPEDETPVETELNLDVNIEVQPWTAVDMNEPLG